MLMLSNKQMLLLSNKLAFTFLFLAVFLANVPFASSQDGLSDSVTAQSIEDSLYSDQYTKDSGTKLFGMDLAPGITVEGPGITGNKESSEGFFFEKTIKIEPDTDIEALLKIIESKLPDGDDVLKSFLNSLHYSFKEEKILAYVKVHFRPDQLPFLKSSHVVIGNLVSEKEKMENWKEELRREETASLSTITSGNAPQTISLFGSPIDAADSRVAADSALEESDRIAFDRNRFNQSGSVSCLGGGTPEPMISLTMFQRGNTLSSSIVVPEDTDHRIEIGYSVLNKLMGFHCKPVLNKNFSQNIETDNGPGKVTGALNSLLLNGSTNPEFKNASKANSIILKVKSSGTMFIDTTGPNYKSKFSLPSYRLSLDIDSARKDSEKLLLLKVRGFGRVSLKCESLIARFSHNFMADSVVGGITGGISDSLSGMANLLKDFLDVGDVKIANVNGINQYETGGTLSFDLNIQSEEIAIDLQKTSRRYYGDDCPVELSRFKVYDNDRIVIDFKAK